VPCPRLLGHQPLCTKSTKAPSFHPAKSSRCSAHPGICLEWWETGKQKKKKDPKFKAPKHVTDKYTVRFNDNKVEREVEKLIKLQEEEKEEGPEEAANTHQVEDFGVDERGSLKLSLKRRQLGGPPAAVSAAKVAGNWAACGLGQDFLVIGNHS
jgi:hypothetical protein